jgi:hypothetical protein
MEFTSFSNKGRPRTAPTAFLEVGVRHGSVGDVSDGETDASQAPVDHPPDTVTAPAPAAPVEAVATASDKPQP